MWVRQCHVLAVQWWELALGLAERSSLPGDVLHHTPSTPRTKQPAQVGLVYRLSWHTAGGSVGITNVGKEECEGLYYWCVSYTWPVNWQNTSVCCQPCEPSEAQNIHQATLGFSSCSSLLLWRVERTDLEDNGKILRLFYRFLYIFF